MANEIMQSSRPSAGPLPKADYTLALLTRAAAEQTIPAEKLEAIRTALHQAAADRAAAYTKGRSTTVTRKQAEAFYASVFCQLDAVLLELGSDQLAEDALRTKPLSELLDAGMLLTLQRYEEAKERFRQAYKLTAPVQTSFFHALLKDFEAFCTRYDARFRAADTKVTFSYPLLGETKITERGVAGVYRYYTALMYEGRLLQMHDTQEIRSLMRRYAENFRTSPDMIAENLAELVLRHRLIRCLCGETGNGLTVTAEMPAQVEAEYAAVPQEQLTVLLCRVTEQICADEPDVTAYCRSAMPALAAALHHRIEANRVAGWLAAGSPRGHFPPDT